MKFKSIALILTWLIISVGTALTLRDFLLSQDLNSTSLASFGGISLNLEYTINTGVNFGLVSDAKQSRQAFLASLAIAVCILIIFWGIRASSKWAPTTAGLFAGGGLANAIERLKYGGVFDYINVQFSFFENPFSFNVADIFIFVGLILFIAKPEAT